MELSWRLVLGDGSAAGGILNETHMLSFRDTQYMRADVAIDNTETIPPDRLQTFQTEI